MPSGSVRTAVAAVALAALAALVGVLGYSIAREDSPAATTTTTTTIDPRGPIVDDIASALLADADLPLSRDQAACIGGAMYDGLGQQRLRALEAAADPLATLDEAQRDVLVRGVVTCVSPDVAQLMLGRVTSTSVIISLPDEGSG